MKISGILVLIILLCCWVYQKAEYSRQSNLITLIKSGCRKKHSVYEININKEGEVLYQGISNVTKKGIYMFKLNKLELDGLQELFAEINFLKVKLHQKTKYHDVAYTTLQYKGKSHHYHSSLKELPFITIEKKLDEVIKENITTDNKKINQNLTSFFFMR